MASLISIFMMATAAWGNWWMKQGKCWSCTFYAHGNVFDSTRITEGNYLSCREHANPNSFSVGSTPLHQAVGIEDIEIVNFLIDNAANIHAVDSNGQTPLHWVSTKTNSEITLELIKRGGRVNPRSINGATPLHLAAYSDQADNIEILLKSDSQVPRHSGQETRPLPLWNEWRVLARRATDRCREGKTRGALDCDSSL